MSRAPTLHICNTFFESELESPIEKPLVVWMRSHPVVRMLQTLPMQYASSEDLVLYCDRPKSVKNATAESQKRFLNEPFLRVAAAQIFVSGTRNVFIDT